MISRKDLKALLTLESDPNSPVLSVFLDIDQSRAVNLNRGFEAVLKSTLQRLERNLDRGAIRKNFLADSEQAIRFVSEYRPDAKSIALYCDASREFLWCRSLMVPIETQAFWEERPYIRPVMEIRKEFGRLGIVLTGRARTRFFTIFLGEIQEHEEAFAAAEVKQFDSSGSDQMLSQPHFKRKAEEHARWHLKHVAELTDRLLDHEKFDRLLLGGAPETTAELKGLLSDRLRKVLIGSLPLPVDSGKARIFKDVFRFQADAERRSELCVVEGLLTAAAKNKGAVTGIPSTLQALNEGRVRELVYSDRFSASGVQCVEFGELFERGGESCPLCDGPTCSVNDLLGAVIYRVLEEGGAVEPVRLSASEELLSKGSGIGAYLRF